ncbi:UDP-glycosyltransferase 87A2-like [Typha angustifolia]|uniref:UDP-glycosyltransferase 87A2-like n=1 Tax=Typha angustifolia TaxID=59011 RepID=UPI003C30ACBC
MDSPRSTAARHVVVIPYPGRGHINPMLPLCRRLASRRGLLVTVVVTDEWLDLLSSSSPASAPVPGVRFRSIPNVLPSERTRASEYSVFLEAVMTKMERHVEEIVEGIEPKVDLILVDLLLPWAEEIGRRRGIPVAALFTELASHELKRLGEDSEVPKEDHEILRYLPKASSDLPDFTSKFSGKSLLTIFTEMNSWYPRAQCLLFNSIHEIETHTLNALKSKISVPIYSIGPSIPHHALEEETPADTHYFKWLDSQPNNSVLYVSLGSFLPLSSAEMEEMTMGLKISGHRVLWTVRGDSAGIRDLINGDMGVVVSWCDQLRVLCHPSVGGFLTHCGWNSTLEALYSGVPMLTYPLMWDQYPNSKLVVDEWGVGFRLKDEKKDDESVPREVIAKFVRVLMDLEADESLKMRRRAQELKEICHRAIDDQKGSSNASIDSFIRDIACGTQKVGERSVTV